MPGDEGRAADVVRGPVAVEDEDVNVVAGYEGAEGRPDSKAGMLESARGTQGKVESKSAMGTRTERSRTFGTRSTNAFGFRANRTFGVRVRWALTPYAVTLDPQNTAVDPQNTVFYCKSFGKNLQKVT